MSTLIIIAVLIALIVFSIARHWKARNAKMVIKPSRHPRRR
ncbi:hypothetical protein [Paramixta manurensis]